MYNLLYPFYHFLPNIRNIACTINIKTIFRIYTCYLFFFDELWMFGIPLGHILPDMSDFHIEGFHHWMFGFLLMAVIMIQSLYSRIKTRNMVIPEDLLKG